MDKNVLTLSGPTMSTLQHNTQTECRIMRLHQLIEYIGLSRSTIYDLMDKKSSRHDATFPKRIQLASNSVGWVKSEIDAWLDAKINSCRQ